MQGTDLEFMLRYLAGSPAEPVDLTGWTGKAQVRRSTNAEALWLELNVSLSSDGFIVMTAPHVATEGEPWDSRAVGVWDLELTDPSGHITRLAAGDVRISHEVTRD